MESFEMKAVFRVVIGITAVCNFLSVCSYQNPNDKERNVSSLFQKVGNIKNRGSN